MTATLDSLHRYPVKSCRGEALQRAVVEPWGLEGDRRWMVVDTDGAFVTSRSAHRLLTVRADVTPGGLRLGAPGRDDLDVAAPDPRRQVDVGVWASSLTAAPAGPDADAWLSDHLGRAVRLVHLDDPTRRPTNPELTRADDRVSFADGYPMLVTTTASLAALDADVAAAAGEGEHPTPLPMHRFRPNLVVDGVEPWVEDSWRRIRVGDVTFRVVKACGRCVMTTLEPDHGTGDVAKGKEPLRTLARTRRHGKAVLFGMNVVPDVVPIDGRWPTLHVGAEVEVLESVPRDTPPLGH